VSDVVVVTGAGTVVCEDVVVVVCVGSVAQAHSDRRATAARHGAMSFFINTIVGWLFALRPQTTQLAETVLWGVGPRRPDA
jgi:hypothetical protein